MEIASTFVAAVTPPPFQMGAEEARRDTIAREQIPAPKNSQSSQANDKAADQKGSTSGTNSQLQAQADGIAEAKSNLKEPIKQIKDQNHQGQQRRQSSKQDGNAQQNSDAELQQLNQTPSQQAQLAISSQSYTSSTAKASSAPAFSNTNPQNAQEKKTYEKSEKKAGARFIKSDKPEMAGMAVRQMAIARRYNQSYTVSEIGRNFQIFI